MEISFKGTLAALGFVGIVVSNTVWDSHWLETVGILTLVISLIIVVVENGPYKLFGKKF